MSVQRPSGTVVIVGQGYVGLPLAMRAVEVGYSVVGFDVAEDRVKRLASGESYIADVVPEQLARALDSGSYEPSTRTDACRGFDVAVITVPTPLHEGGPDLSHIRAAGSTLAEFVRPGSTVILESTSYPGTTDELLVPILEEGSGLTAGEDFSVGYSPERIDPGNPTWSLVNTPKLVSGINDTSLAAVQAFYDTIVERTVVISSPKAAELAKLLENTFRHVNIALVNELAMFSYDLGIDVWEAIDGASSKPFGFMPFTPGPGVGGHCLPVDPSYLSWRVRRDLGCSFRFVELANEVNAHMPDYVMRRSVVALNSRSLPVNGSRILLLGLAYKRNSSDARGSPAMEIARKLLALGADVRGADPHVADADIDVGVIRVEATPQELAAADLVILLTDHDAFDYGAVARHGRCVLDTRHRVRAEGIEYL